jgi:hypothetical protein
MKTEAFDGVIENFYGKPLPTALTYATSYDKFENADEVRAANSWPKDSDVVDFVNARAKATARQKAMQAAVDAAGIIKPTLENDDQMKLREMARILVAAGKSEQEARDIASATLGLSWEDGE